MRARPLLVTAVTSTLAAALLLPAQAAITPTAPVTISGAGSQTSGSHQLDVDTSGRAITVWLETVEGVAQLRSAEREPATGTWSAPVDLTTGTIAVTGFAFDMNEAGDAAVVFRRSESGGGRRLWGTYRASGSSTWGPADAFGGLVHGVDTSGDFGVAVMSDGTAVSAYVAPDGTPGLPDTTRRAYAGTGGTGGWSGEVHISDTGHIPVVGDQEQRDVSSVAIAADGAGTARVLMRMEAHSQSQGWTRYRLMRTTRTTSTGWTSISPFTPITEPEYAAPASPRIEGDPNAAGGYVEGWSEVTDDGVDVVVASVGGDRQTFEDDDGDPASNDDMFSAEMRMRNGVAAINTIYSRPVEVGQDSVARVGTAVWRTGAGWSALMDPVEDPQYGATRPRLTVHADGTLTQAYDSGFGTSTNVYVSQLPPASTTWSGERNISRYSPTDGHADFRASVAATADGAVVIWSRNQGGTPTRYTVEAASFTGSATVSPTPTSPTTTTGSPSPSPTVTAPAPVPPPTSVPTAPAAPLPSSFVAVVQSTVKGKPIVGTALKARPGTWQPTPAKVTYQWRAGSKAIKKATRPRLKLAPALGGKKVSVRITLAAPGVSTRTVTVKVKGRVKS